MKIVWNERFLRIIFYQRHKISAKIVYNMLFYNWKAYRNKFIYWYIWLWWAFNQKVRSVFSIALYIIEIWLYVCWSSFAVTWNAFLFGISFFIHFVFAFGCNIVSAFICYTYTLNFVMLTCANRFSNKLFREFGSNWRKEETE